MTQLTTKTARELERLKDYLNTHYPETFGYQSAKQEYDRIISMKNELKEARNTADRKDNVYVFYKFCNDLIQEIESVENDQE